MPDADREHWEKVYRTKSEKDLSWYQPHLAQSIDLITGTGIGPGARIIDVGGGASTLVDDLLDRGFRDITVLDIAEAALHAARRRLGPRASTVTWLAGDITTVSLPPNAYDLWHDRAVFHFLTAEVDRRAYIERVCFAVKPGGFVVVATFGPQGPEKCSGLPVVRYSADEIPGAFGEAFQLLDHREERHQTPWGREQEFVYCLCTRAKSC
jgi:ubiquinone/menaquinone biosynthesis C-methylase UbiE